MFSLREGFTDDERDRLGEMLDRVYADFVEKVADGRGMTVRRGDTVARGRIWSGADAAGNGLVDSLGGLRDAADSPAIAAGLRRRPGAPGGARAAAGPARPGEVQRRPTRTRRRTVSRRGATSPRSPLRSGCPNGPLRMPAVRLA